MEKDSLWINFLELIKTKISPICFETWFKDTKLYSLEGGIAKIIVPMSLHKKHFQDNYMDLISENFNILTGTNFDFEFILEDEVNLKKKKNTEESGVPYNNPVQANINPNYTFENYVKGSSNSLAYTAALAVAEKPGKAYNPLFIYGNSGLGKTHLMHAIGNYILTTSNKKVLYVTSERFISDFININRKDSNNDFVEAFKNKYRSLDVLIIDDIQFLSNATQSQQEFFHTFNELHQEGKQIIISSDRSPDDLKLLEERLRTRFNWGLACNILPPDYDLRIEILKKKLSVHELARPLSNDVIEFIASNCDSDVRKLEGALNRLFAYTAMFNKEKIDLNVAVEALSDYLVSASYLKNNIQKIKKIVCDYYNITVEEMVSKKRSNYVTLPRQVAMYLCRMITDESFPTIGFEFGGRDHSTVMHACNKIEIEIKKNKDFKNVLDQLKLKLK